MLDLAGNVWEWTSSPYQGYPYQADDGREDPESGDGRSLRGGSFDFNVSNVRCAARSGYDPNYRVYDVGFRVVSPGF